MKITKLKLKQQENFKQNNPDKIQKKNNHDKTKKNQIMTKPKN